MDMVLRQVNMLGGDVVERLCEVRLRPEPAHHVMGLRWQQRGMLRRGRVSVDVESAGLTKILHPLVVQARRHKDPE
eukprot:2051674-Amphidinium_carterae.1